VLWEVGGLITHPPEDKRTFRKSQRPLEDLFAALEVPGFRPHAVCFEEFALLHGPRDLRKCFITSLQSFKRWVLVDLPDTLLLISRRRLRGRQSGAELEDNAIHHILLFSGFVAFFATFLKISQKILPKVPRNRGRILFPGPTGHPTPVFFVLTF
jgi:hypothetical protein